MATSAFSFGFGPQPPSDPAADGAPPAKRAHRAAEAGEGRAQEGRCVAASLPLARIRPRLMRTFVETVAYGAAEIKVYNESAVAIRMREEGIDSKSALAVAEAGNTDLIPGVYEGGLKLWEAAEDLVAYLGRPEVPSCKGKRVAELGCGGGYAGVLAFAQGAEHVAWQDYNADVLEHWTMLNVACNLGETAGDEEACRRASFFAGDWSSLGPVMRPAEAKPFDVIVMAETVYSPASYDRLRDLICHLQDGCDEAVVYLASKSYYFGVGGSTRDFEQVMAKVNYASETVWQAPDGVKREIIRFTRAKSGGGKAAAPPPGQ